MLEYENITNTWTDDFITIHVGGYWNPDMLWLSDAQWNHLPNDFRGEPRESISAD